MKNTLYKPNISVTYIRSLNNRDCGGINVIEHVVQWGFNSSAIHTSRLTQKEIGLIRA